MGHTWSGHLQIGAGWAVFHGRTGDNAPHQHFAAQLVWSDDSVFTLMTNNETQEGDAERYAGKNQRRGSRQHFKRLVKGTNKIRAKKRRTGM